MSRSNEYKNYQRADESSRKAIQLIFKARDINDIPLSLFVSRSSVTAVVRGSLESAVPLPSLVMFCVVFPVDV